MYNGTLADMGLTVDPWTNNRYAFTGGNPISNIELDGHLFEFLQAGSTFRQGLSIAVGFVPILGDVNDAITLITGYDVIAGEETPRWMAAAALFAGGSAALYKAGAKTVEAAAGVIKSTDEAAGAIRSSDDVAAATTRSSGSGSSSGGSSSSGSAGGGDLERYYLQTVQPNVANRAVPDEALVARVNEIHGALRPIEQNMRTTAIVEAYNPANGSFRYLVASSSEYLTPAQRNMLINGEKAVEGLVSRNA